MSMAIGNVKPMSQLMKQGGMTPRSMPMASMVPQGISSAQRQQFTQALNPNAPSFLPIRADANATYANPYAGQSNPQAGNWGAGGGGANRYDYTQTGSGLHSIGIDRSSPTAINDAIRWYQSQGPGTRAEIGALGGRNVNDPTGLLNTIDQRQRDVARKIQKENGFFDSTLGQIMGFALPMAAGGLFGPMAAMGTSAVMGGARGGLPGAVMGGLSSAISPALSMSGGLGGLARSFATPTNLARQAASSAISSVNRRQGQ